MRHMAGGRAGCGCPCNAVQSWLEHRDATPQGLSQGHCRGTELLQESQEPGGLTSMMKTFTSYSCFMALLQCDELSRLKISKA